MVIRLWKVFTEDEGVHSLCQYLVENPNIEVLDLLDNKISYLGCNYLGKMFKNSMIQLNISKVIYYQYIVNDIFAFNLLE